MELIARYRNAGFTALADGVMAFFERRRDLQRPGIAFGPALAADASCPQAGAVAEPAKVSTDISLVAIDRSDPEAFALAEVIVRGVSAALEHYLQERPLLRDCCPERSLFVNPIFNLQRYAPGEGFKRWHCDWTISDEAPSRCTACWPGSSIAMTCRRAAPSSTGSSITRRPSGASSCSSPPGPPTSIAAG